MLLCRSLYQFAPCARYAKVGSDEKLFEAYRELIEQVASDAYDAGTSVDDAGLVLVTSEALARVSRSA